jgi:signal transduction histidine kinase
MSLVLYRWLNYPLKKIAESFSAENPQIIKSLAGKKNEFGEIALMIERFFHQKEKLAEIIKGKNEALVSLSDAESKNRIILSAISDHIFRINLFGVITDFHIKTPDELISDTQSLIGKNFETVVPAHIVPILQRAICAVNENKQTQHFDFSLIPNNPKTKYYEVTLSLTSEGGYLIVIRNISTRKQAEMALYRMLEKEADLNRLKTQFVSTVSHEFRTPLSAISSNIQLLDLYEEKWPADKKLTVFSRIKEAINQMTALLDDLSVIARDQYGKFKLAPIELNLELFCREIAEEIMATSRPGGNIQMEFLCEGAVVNMDPRLLRHIFSNLLINAVKFSAPGSPVLFKLEDQNKNLILITIQDHGIGISEEDLVNIFEPFHRGENVAGYPGTGLGLSIVKRCVNQHKGSISVMSRLTEGTTVTVVLPKKYHPGEPNGEKTL